MKMEPPSVKLRLPVDRRKPPLSHHQLPQRASVINLDKNRIRHARRILPRPLSLPNGFKLMRQLGISNVIDGPKVINASATVDLAVIKQLEDDIYNRKRGDSPSSENLRKICRIGAKCTKCNAECVPVSIGACRLSVASQAIMLLDAWQHDPLLRKYSGPAHVPDELPHTPPAHTLRSNQNLAQPHPCTEPDQKQLLSIDDVKRRPISLSSKRHSKSVFQRCISSGSGTTTDEEDDFHLAIRSPPPPPSHPEEASSRKLSKFRRFVLHRRSLNLSRPNATRISNNNHSETEPVMTNQPNQPDALPIAVRPNQFVGSLRPRQWRSDDDIYETMDSRPPEDVRRTTRLLSRHEDIGAKLIDLERMQKQLDQLSVDLAKRRQILLGDVGDFGGGNGLVKHETTRQRSPSMLLFFQNNQKRHSIGSPTDLVKTWEYRRRYIDTLHFFTQFNFSILTKLFPFSKLDTCFTYIYKTIMLLLVKKVSVLNLCALTQLILLIQNLYIYIYTYSGIMFGIN